MAMFSGLRKRRSFYCPPLTKKNLEEKWYGGEKITEIAHHFGVSVSTIHAYRQKWDLRFREQIPKSFHPDPTPEEIEIRKKEIRDRHMALMRAMP